ncbi:MAG: N-acetyltransferase [Thermoplasmata archaeon]|nr:MAG: N-acetyltransferase [Thermoplasmata archaeon]
MVSIRRATQDDLSAITEIYNYAILKTTATFDTEPKTVEEQKAWFEDHGSQNPILVAELDTVIVGWAALSKWSDRCAYSDTAEISLYVKEEYQGQKIGKILMERILEEGREAGLHTVIARIVEGNEISIHLHESNGFVQIGIMKEVGKKFGKLLDVYLLQKIYENQVY